MPSPSDLAQAVLDALDPARGGGFSADLAEVQAYVKERGIACDARRVAKAVERLVAERQVERVETDDGPRFTRPEVLLRAPGLLSLAARAASVDPGRPAAARPRPRRRDPS